MLVTNVDAPTGGVQKNSRLLLQEFSKRGIGTYVCARNYYDMTRNESDDGATLHRAPIFGRSLAINGVVYLIDTFLWLIRNKKKYDVIHCQQMFGPTMAAAVASFVVRKPIVSRITLSGRTGEVDSIHRLPLAKLRLLLIRRVSKWIALTREMADELKTLNIPDEKIRIIHNSTEIPADAAFDVSSNQRHRKELGIDYKKIGVFVGRLSEEKNLDILISAWKSVLEKHEGAHLLLLGEGGDYRNVAAQLHQQVDKLGLQERVHFLGHVSNVKDYLLASDVFVLPTQAEGMSNALVEAFACGAAIVATDIEANKEICEDGVNSLLVPVGDADALAHAVEYLFDSAELSQKLARSARKKAESELSVETMVEAYLQTYREIISSSR